MLMPQEPCPVLLEPYPVLMENVATDHQPHHAMRTGGLGSVEGSSAQENEWESIQRNDLRFSWSMTMIMTFS
jgi:hypothetical protein